LPCLFDLLRQKLLATSASGSPIPVLGENLRIPYFFVQLQPINQRNSILQSISSTSSHSLRMEYTRSNCGDNARRALSTIVRRARSG
jgi:hypothetical protein